MRRGRRQVATTEPTPLSPPRRGTRCTASGSLPSTLLRASRPGRTPVAKKFRGYKSCPKSTFATKARRGRFSSDSILRNEPKLARQRKSLRKLRWCDCCVFMRKNGWRRPWAEVDEKPTTRGDGRDARATIGKRGARPTIGRRDACPTRISGGQLEEVGEDLFAAFGEDGFGVELDAPDGKLLVADAHDLAFGFGLSGDLQRVGQ